MFSSEVSTKSANSNMSPEDGLYLTGNVSALPPQGSLNLIDILSEYGILRTVVSYLTTEELYDLAVSSIGLWDCINPTKKTMHGLMKLTACDGQRHMRAAWKERGLLRYTPYLANDPNEYECKGFNAKACVRCAVMVCSSCRAIFEKSAGDDVMIPSLLETVEMTAQARELYFCQFCVDEKCAFATSLRTDKICQCTRRTALNRWLCLPCTVKVVAEDMARVKRIRDHRKQAVLRSQPYYPDVYHGTGLVQATVEKKFKEYGWGKPPACACEPGSEGVGVAHCECCGLDNWDIAVVGCAWCSGRITKESAEPASCMYDSIFRS